MNRTFSFGYWVRRQRKALDLTQLELAERAACSLSAIKKIEQDKRRPSRQLAEVLASCLVIPEKEQELFLHSARGLAPVDQMPLASKPLDSIVGKVDRAQVVKQGNLPVAISPMFGRELELERIIKYISSGDSRLITLTGPGGVGKSRLALEVARRLQGSFQDGTWFVTLSGVEDPTYLISAIAVVRGFNFAGPLQQEQQLIRQLHGEHLLLLLDNFEQLLPDGAEFVSSMIQRLPQLTILVTSRERLHLQAEVIIPVDGLNLEPARDLFVERAQRTGAELITEQSANTKNEIEGICRLVGGIPLAIELAATWTRLLSPREILSNLEHSLDLLTGSQQDLPKRHRSMQAVFEDSWSRLPSKEQKLLSGLSVFAGSFSRDAANAICGATLPQLAMLQDFSLIQRDNERFRLHELVRHFALERLSSMSSRKAAVNARHASYYIGLLGRLSGLILTGSSELTDWQRCIEQEIENIHLAWLWTISNEQPQRLLPATLALSLYLDIRGQVREGLKLFAMLSESIMNARAGGSVDDSRLRRTQAMALVVQGALNLRKGEFERGQEEIRLAESILEGLDAPNERIVILPQLGLVAMLTKDYATAQRVIEDALTLAQRASQIWGQAVSLNFLGLLKLIQGQPEEARDLLNDSVSLWSKQKGLTYGKVRSLAHLGIAYHTLGNYESAQSIQEEALNLAQKIKDNSFLPLSQCNLAFHHYAQGKLELAKDGFRTGLAEAQRYELLNFVWYSIIGLGLVAAAEGFTRRAVTLLTFGLDRPGGYTSFLLGEPQRVLSDLRNSLPITDFAVAEDKAREMNLADLMAWL